MCTCSPCAGACAGYKRISDLELELVMSYLILVLGTELESPERAISALNH